jgi:molecular chaperone GrpE
MNEENKTTEEGLDLTENSSEKVELEDIPMLGIDVLKKQLSESEDKYLRLFADFENYKKRVTKEKEELVANTKVKTLTSILDMDNDISIALKNIKDDSAKQGVLLIANKLEKFLHSQGIESIQTETYDEDLHEVISVMDIGESKIIDVVSKGYTLNGKAFRHPKIVLGK